MGWTHVMADFLGGSEPGLRLILGQMTGYPLLIFVYRKYLHTKDANLQHLFFFLTGLFVGQWVIGDSVVHSVYTILFNYLLLLTGGGTVWSVVVSFIFNMIYLLVGYWHKQEDDTYDISWTMPQCVLCLRMIGLAFDLLDGEESKKNPANLSQDQKKNAITDSPGLLEMLSFSFFIGGYFVGPQFSLRRYRDFISPGYQDSLPASPLRFGLKRLLIGLAYLTGHVVLSQYLPEHWPSTSEYREVSFGWRLLALIVWTKTILAKYLSAWLISEGVCVVSGLSYAGKYEDGSPNWTGCANVKLRRLESAQRFGHYIEAFNINTNGWVASYVYKRLKFLNNKKISQLSTLVFLAVWHGFHPGYYLTFFNEFIVMNFEQDFQKFWSTSRKVSVWKDHPAYTTITTALGWVYCHFFLPHCFMPFPLLSVEKIVGGYNGVLWLHLVFYLGWFVAWRGLVKVFLDVQKPETVAQ